MAYSLMFSQPGTPTLYYGEEIGMGEDLAVDGRMAVRTPMQWSAAAQRRLLDGRPAAADPAVVTGACGPEHVNVVAQMHDPDSLWSFMRKLISIRRTCPELGWGTWSVVEQPERERARAPVPARRVGRPHGAQPRARTPSPSRCPSTRAATTSRRWTSCRDEVLTGDATTTVALDGYGYRWLRVRPAGDLAIP